MLTEPLKKAYERMSAFHDFGVPRRIYILRKGGGGARIYAPEVKEKDILVLLGVEGAHQCPRCGSVSKFLNTIAFSFADQVAMWEEVFKAKVKPGEKRKQLEWLKRLYEEKLAKGRLEGWIKEK